MAAQRALQTYLSAESRRQRGGHFVCRGLQRVAREASTAYRRLDLRMSKKVSLIGSPAD
jgi:hypothetical protein